MPNEFDFTEQFPANVNILLVHLRNNEDIEEQVKKKTNLSFIITQTLINYSIHGYKEEWMKWNKNSYTHWCTAFKTEPQKIPFNFSSLSTVGLHLVVAPPACFNSIYPPTLYCFNHAFHSLTLPTLCCKCLTPPLSILFGPDFSLSKNTSQTLHTLTHN